MDMTDDTQPPRNSYPVIVIGGGQAGLAISYCLCQRGIEHLILERHQIAHAWRHQRWDSFCLVTPNWQCQLPGFAYAGDDPHGFMRKLEIVEYMESYARMFTPPVREGVTVTRLARRPDGLFELETSAGDYTAAQVVVATGGYHLPQIPRCAERLPEDVLQLPAAEYRNPQALPAGEVLVVGSGQSGCQIAEDLHLAGRRVHLCVGGAPRSPRRYRGKDVVEWLDQMGHYDLPIDRHPLKEHVREKANHYLTGRDGGREIDLRRFALEGMQLYGRLSNVRGAQLEFTPGLAQSLDQADAVAAGIKQMIDKYIAAQDLQAPVEPPYQPPWRPSEEVLTLDYRAAGISSVIWCIGYRSDYRWIDLPLFDGKGYPQHSRGVTSMPGVYFLGLPWLYTWGSGRFSAIARDAHYLADQIQARQPVAAAPASEAAAAPSPR